MGISMKKKMRKYEKKNEENEYISLWALPFFHHLILHKGSKCDLGKNKACGCL
jgi:hypothetical protein